MEGEVRDECGIAAVSLSGGLSDYPEGGAAYYLYKMLLQQQHRGQLSAGITTYNTGRPQLIDTYKKLGKVDNVFRMYRKERFLGILNKYTGSKGIGHVRYATSGTAGENLAQPFERHHGKRWKWFSLAFNGTLTNYKEIKGELINKDYYLIRDTDTEALMHCVSKQLVGDKEPPLEDVWASISEMIDGSYSISFINAEGKLAVLRDPLGFKPLCYGEKDGRFMAASESVAFSNDEEVKVHTVKPGEIITVVNDSVEKKRFAKSNKISHCMFEWLYFASPNSTIDGKNVYQVRQDIGKALAKYETQEMDDDFIVVSVPDTAKPFGDALAFELGVPMKEGITRNRYVGRTFIESDDRTERVREKYSLIKSVVKGKKILLVEDSLVRGTTTKILIDRLRRYGKAKEIHVRVACPAILAPCFYGIAMPTIEELLVPSYVKDIKEGLTSEESERLAKDYGVDSLVYLPMPEIPKAIGLPKSELCMACLNSDYPTEEGKKDYQRALANSKEWRGK